MSDVEIRWSEIREWTSRNAPETAGSIRPGASRAMVTEAQRFLQRDLPADLLAWFGVQGGAPDVIPQYEILDLATALDVWEMMQELMADQYGAAYYDRDARSVALGESEPAGREARMFLPSFIPIAARNDNYLFVDIRVGENTGCVTAWDYSTTDQDGPLWAGLVDMLDELLHSLNDGTEFFGQLPITTDGRLSWAG